MVSIELWSSTSARGGSVSEALHPTVLLAESVAVSAYSRSERGFHPVRRDALFHAVPPETGEHPGRRHSRADGGGSAPPGACGPPVTRPWASTPPRGITEESLAL